MFAVQTQAVLEDEKESLLGKLVEVEKKVKTEKSSNSELQAKVKVGIYAIYR